METATENLTDQQKQIIVAIAVLYEWSFVRWGIDPSKSGYVLKHLETGSLFSQVPTMIDDLKQLLEKHKLEPTDADCIAAVIQSYNQHGVNEAFGKEVLNALLANENIRESFERNPLLSKIIITGLDKDAIKFED